MKKSFDEGNEISVKKEEEIFEQMVTLTLDNFKKTRTEDQRERKKTQENVKKLEDIIQEMKIQTLVNNFAKKISMNNIERDPVEFSPFDEKVDRSTEMNGVEIPNILLNGFYFVSIINIIIMWVIISMSAIFAGAARSKEITAIQAWVTVWMMGEIIVNFVRVSYRKGYHKLEKITEIAKEYLKGKFGIDILCLIGLIIDLAVESELTIIARVFFLLKAVDFFEKVEVL